MPVSQSVKSTALDGDSRSISTDRSVIYACPILLTRPAECDDRGSRGWATWGMGVRLGVRLCLRVADVFGVTQIALNMKTLKAASKRQHTENASPARIH